jgi:hypothetical protein
MEYPPEKSSDEPQPQKSWIALGKIAKVTDNFSEVEMHYHVKGTKLGSFSDIGSAVAAAVKTSLGKKTLLQVGSDHHGTFVPLSFAEVQKALLPKARPTNLSPAEVKTYLAVLAMHDMAKAA